MEFKEFKSLGINTDEGVLITKYLVAIHMANFENAKAIKNKFVEHNYKLDIVPGEFLKTFTMNEKEIAEISSVLDEIEERGLKDVFQANLRPLSFKRSFLERIKFCINNKFPYLNEDNTFISELNDAKAFAEYTAHKPVEMIKTVQELNKENESNQIDGLNDLDPEDRQVYNKIIERLSYLTLQYPTNEKLIDVINNIKIKVIDSLKRKEYHFLPIDDIVSSVMFEGIDVTPEIENIRDLVLSALPVEQELNEGRRLA